VRHLPCFLSAFQQLPYKLVLLQQSIMANRLA